MKQLEAVPGCDSMAEADERLVRVLDDYLSSLESGHAIDPELLFAQHPNLAPRLRACLAGLQLLDDESARARPPAAPTIALAGFQIVREAGRGGMGIVYEAVQSESGRRVALKLLPFAATLDSRRLQRFEIEAHAAARLNHPHIVPVHDVCLTGQAHFYTMQFIDGASLAAVLHHQRRKARLAARQDKPRASGDTVSAPQTTAESPHDLARLVWDSPDYIGAIARLIEQAAAALDYAHQVGVIHRDIKPGNLLVDRDGHLWITDFGLASVRGATGVTATGDLLGTIRYMSPEQVSARRGVVDHRSDIYSLGVTLYELLTLQAPFPGSDPQFVLARMADEEPRPPRRLNPSIPERLETIVLKAMARSPDERYATAAALADDLRRFRSGEPIAARRPAVVTRLARWAQRRRGLVAAIALSLVVVMAGLAASTVVSYRALQAEAQQRALAEGRELQSRRHLYAAEMNLALDDWQAGNVSRVFELLDRQIPPPGQTDLRKFEWNHLRRMCQYALRKTLDGHQQPVSAVAAAANNTAWASADREGTICLWDPVSYTLKAKIETRAKVHSLTISPDGQRIAAACDDKSLQIWDVERKTRVATLEGYPLPITATAFSGDGLFLAYCSNNVVYVCDAATLTQRAMPAGHDNSVNCLAFSPDGTMLASGGNDRRVILWDLKSDEPIARVLGHHHVYVHCVAFSPDGQTLLSGSEDGNVQLWDVAARRLNRSFRRHTGAVAAAAFAPDGRRIASVSWDGSLRLWDATTDELLLQQGHNGQVVAVAFAPDGKSILTGGDDAKVQVWNPDARSEPVVLNGHKALIRSVNFSQDSRSLVSTGADHTVRLWDLNSSQEPILVGEHSEWGMGAVFANSGKLISADVKGNVRQWDIRTQESTEFDPAGGQLWSIALTPDGKVLAGAGYVSNTVLLWDTATGRLRATLRGHTDRVWSVAISPDGRTVASGSNDLTVRLWDLASGRQQAVIPVPASYVFTLAISPDGKTLAVCGDDHRIRLWHLPTLREHPSLGQHSACIRCAAFFPDGQTLATGSDDGTVKLWDLTTRQERATFHIQSPSVWSIAISADGLSLAAGDNDGHVTVWQASPNLMP